MFARPPTEMDTTAPDGDALAPVGTLMDDPMLGLTSIAARAFCTMAVLPGQALAGEAHAAEPHTTRLRGANSGNLVGTSAVPLAPADPGPGRRRPRQSRLADAARCYRSGPHCLEGQVSAVMVFGREACGYARVAPGSPAQAAAGQPSRQ